MTERLLHSLGAEGCVGGVLSGTSGDGIDVVVARCGFEGAAERPRLARIEALAFETVPFPTELAPRVRAALDGARYGAAEGGGPLDVRGVALLSRDLGLAFGGAARAVARDAGLALELLGSHGLTVWHHDGRDVGGAATLQLGDGDFVAEAAGCAVVSDFRQRDVAAGGEGAPIAALVDDVLFAAAPRPLAVLNLGGIGNLTWLPELGGGGALLSFDTGPANSLLDGLARRLLDRPYDADGAAAARGSASAALVEEALAAEPFFALAPPKSTGRDSFGEDFVEAFLVRAARLAPGSAPEDLLAGAVELVAASVARAAREHLPAAPRALALCGGGAHHRLLAARLAALLAGTELLPGEVLGVPADAREAMAFAALAARAAVGEPSTAPSATGAAAGRVLGKISPAPR